MEKSVAIQPSKAEIRNICNLFLCYENIVTKYINTGVRSRNNSLENIKKEINETRLFAFRSSEDLSQSSVLTGDELEKINNIIDNLNQIELTIKKIKNDNNLDLEAVYKQDNLQNVLNFITDNTISEEMVNTHQGLSVDLFEFFLKTGASITKLAKELNNQSCKEIESKFDSIKTLFTASNPGLEKHIQNALSNNQYIRNERGNIESAFVDKQQQDHVLKYEIFKNCAKVLKDMQVEISKLGLEKHAKEEYSILSSKHNLDENYFKPVETKISDTNQLQTTHYAQNTINQQSYSPNQNAPTTNTCSLNPFTLFKKQH